MPDPWPRELVDALRSVIEQLKEIAQLIEEEHDDEGART